MRQSVYTWTERSVVLPLFGGNSVGAVEASATAPVEALRRTAPQGWTRASKTRRGRPLYPRARKGGDAGGRPRATARAGRRRGLCGARRLERQLPACGRGVARRQLPPARPADRHLLAVVAHGNTQASASRQSVRPSGSR